MPVPVACSCGKQLMVPDQYAGKQVRCPACKNILQAPPAAVAAPPAVESATVLMRCDSCGKELRTRAEYAGRQIACPGCKTPLTVPGLAVRSAPPALPAASSPPPMPSMLPADDMEEPSPRRRARPRRVWPWVAAAAALLLLVGGGLAIWYFALRDPRPADLRLVPADAQGFVSVRVADIWKSDDVKKLLAMVPGGMGPGVNEMETAFGITLADLERVTIVTTDFDDDPAAWAIFLFSKPYDQKKFLDKIAPGSTEVTYGKHNYRSIDGEGKKPAFYFHTDRIFVFGTKKGMTACFDQIDKPRSDGPLKTALKEAAGNRQLVAAGVPPVKMLDQMRQNLPPNASPYVPLLEAKLAMLTADLVGKAQTLELTLSYADSAKATQAKEAADGLKSMAVKMLAQFKGQAVGPGVPPQAKQMFDGVEAMLNSVKVEQKKDAVVVAAKFDAAGALAPVMAGLMLPATQKVREAAGRSQSSNNLKQMMIAIHSYHDSTGQFPPRIDPNKPGKPALSWRVYLLPFIEQGQLYKEFHLEESWDSPHNIKLLSRMPATYRVPSQAPADTNTHYQVFVGKDSPFPPNRSLNMVSITDGTSNTIGIVEATRAVPWTKPEDLPFTKSPQGYSPAGLGLPGANTFLAGLLDGSVKSFPKNVNPVTLQAWITPNGGEVVGEP